MSAGESMDKQRLFSRSNRRTQWLLGLFSAFVIVVACMTLSPGLTDLSRSLLGYAGFTGRVNRYLNPFRTRHALLSSGLPIYDLKINDAEYRKILDVVEQAKRVGVLTDDLKIWSNAKLIYEGTVHDVKVRVRGDLPNHWAFARKSWRIRLRRDDAVDGRREFNLIVSSDGKGLTERYCNAMFARLGCATLRDRFALLRINGSLQGLYYDVEHVGKAWMAARRKPEGAVFVNSGKGVDPGDWKEQVTDGDASAWAALRALLRFERDPTPERYRSARSVTDMDDYARFVAGTTFFCADHTAFHLTDNHKVFYERSIGRFQRIPWDIQSQRLPSIQNVGMRGLTNVIDVFARLPMSEFRIASLLDPSFRRRRDACLWSIVKDNTSGELFDAVYADLLNPIWADVMGRGDEVGRLASFRKLIDLNTRRIRAALADSHGGVTIRKSARDILALRVAVKNVSGLLLRSMELGDLPPASEVALYRDANGDGRVDAGDSLVARSATDTNGYVVFDGLDVFLPSALHVERNYTAYLYEGSSNYYLAKPMAVVLFPRSKHHDLLVQWTGGGVDGSSPTLSSIDIENAVTHRRLGGSDLSIRVWPEDAPERTDEAVSVAEFLERHPQFMRDAEQPDVLVIASGVRRFDGTVLMPPGVSLRILAGSELRMGPGAAIVCFGAIEAMGTERSPIRIVGDPGAPWVTMASVRGAGVSRWRNVSVRGGGGGTVHGIDFTGAVAIHHGDAEIVRCRFEGNPAEDALNVKHGRVELRETYFARNASDGVDLDFVEGTVARCHFSDQGGDSIDVSGSTLAIRGCRLERSADKGVSVGEQSDVRIDDSLFVGNTIGLASKDLSTARMSHCTFAESETAVAAYQKKPYFGGASLTVTDSVFVRSSRVSQTGPRSRVVLERCVGGGDSEDGLDHDDVRIRSITELRSTDYVLDRHAQADLKQDAAGQRTPGITGPCADLQ